MHKYIIVMAALLTAATAFAGFGDIISSFPLPSELLVSRGLTWDGAYLWSCDNNYVFRLTTVGSIVSYFGVSPGGYAELHGAAYDGSYLWISEQTLFNPANVTRYTTTGSGVGGFTLYNNNNGAYCGLTWDNGYVWVGGNKYTTSGSLVSSFSTGYGLCDTAFVSHYMWASGPDLTHVYQWTTTGSLVASFPSPDGGQPAGKTFDGQYLWVVSVKASLPYWAYQIDIGVTGADPASLGKVKALYR